MSKTLALLKRMSPYLAEKAKNLIDAMLLSTEEIGWDSQQEFIMTPGVEISCRLRRKPAGISN